jgi:hypothetical protein
MRLGLDIDGTICANPAFYAFLAMAWVAQGGEVHIVSARAESDRSFTVGQLLEWGFGPTPHFLHLYPHPYDYRDLEEMERHYQSHAAWKAAVCRERGIAVLIDDDPRNLLAVREAGIYSLSAGFVGAGEGKVRG